MIWNWKFHLAIVWMRICLVNNFVSNSMLNNKIARNHQKQIENDHKFIEIMCNILISFHY